MQTKKRILIVIDWFFPGFKAGGQIMSCCNLISLLKDTYDFDVFTSDRDLGDTLPYSGISLNQWVQHPDGFRVWYAEKSMIRSGYAQVLSQYPYHVIYLNSFFSSYFTILPLILWKMHPVKGTVVLAPRGMLGKGALAIKKWKKRLFIQVAKCIKLYRGIVWHATSQIEKEEIIEVMGHDVPIVVAGDTGSVSAPIFSQINKEVNSLRLVFISRITEKKNLKFALEVLSQLPEHLKVKYDVFGPIEDKIYWDECIGLISQMPPHIQVHYGGEVSHEQVSQVFTSYHCFFFPTKHENFGHVIHESLSVSCPVLISDQTPWSHLEESHAGISIPLSDQNSFISWLVKIAEMNQEEYTIWRKGAHSYCEAYRKSANLSEAYFYLFQ